MKRSSLVFVLLISMASISFGQQQLPPMRLTSPAFADGAVIPIKYTRASADEAVSPELDWTNVPPGTQSFVLWVHYVDLALNKTSEDNLHWLVWNIPGRYTSLPEKMPIGEHSFLIAAIKSATPDQAIEDPAPRLRARCTIIYLNYLHWI